MSRKQFIEAKGASCSNWIWSWSFINEEDRIIIFGAWDNQTKGSRALIFSQDWQMQDGKKKAGYKQSREHIRLIEEEGYTLMTFAIQHSDEKMDDSGTGTSTIKSFTEKLEKRFLSRDGRDWWACEVEPYTHNPEEVGTPATYIEGASVKISVNSYERNREARQKCLDHYGYDCAVCGFNFESNYGPIGERLIHVHHVIPLHKVKEEY